MKTKLLDENITAQIQEVFEQLQEPVAVLFFGQKHDCQYCDDTLQMAQELVEISDKLSIQIYDIDEDAEVARQYNVDKAPGLVLVGRDGDQLLDYGIRFAGIPSGHEFSSLIHDLVIVSSRDSGLAEETRAFLKTLDKPVRMLVFVTPTCPYCPQSVVVAHQMAMESPMVEAEMVEAMEFPELSNRFHVSGVPQTTINEEAGTVVGSAGEEQLVEEIRQALEVG